MGWPKPGLVMIVSLTYGGEVQLANGSSGKLIWFFHAGPTGSSCAPARDQASKTHSAVTLFPFLITPLVTTRHPPHS